MFRTVAVIVGVFCAVAAHAGSHGELESWGESPESYFMTSAERSEWKALVTADDAGRFVASFRERRGGEAFVKEVAKRVEMADKYLTVGKTKGSTTLRGKLVVLFGAPANIQVSDRTAKKGFVPPPSSAAVTNLGTGASSRDADGDSAQMVSGKPGLAFRDYTFTFSGAAVKGLNAETYVVMIETDLGTGRDVIKDRKQQEDLEAKFESVAQASIRK